MSIPLAKILPNCNDPSYWGIALDENLPIFDINTAPRIAAFIAQTGHESAEYNILSESLNYSKDTLLRVFKKYFPNPEVATMYARKPQCIANRVYANRMGNGPEESGDGWKYRGRGILQVTGKQNYIECSSYLFDNLILLDYPDLLLEPKYAIQSACWYWSANNLNPIADAGDFELLTRRINGGLNGLEHRVEIYERALRVFNVTWS